MVDTKIKYIDADKLKAAINDKVTRNKMFVLNLIDSIQQEQPEADLEKELKEYFSGWADSPDYGQALNSDGECVSTDEVIALARHFAEWGAIHLNARKEE